ncbi:MAG: hypothetical protein V7603_5994 [Micromonosporaceae bacterium]
MTPTVSDAAGLLARWDFDGARPVLEDLVTRLPVDELDGLSARRMLAEVLRELGETEEAYPLAVEAAHECRRRYGPAHPAAVRAGVVLGTVLHDRGVLAEAERQYQLVIDGGAKVDGPAGRALLLAMANLALLHRDRGDADVAVRDLTEAFRVHRATFGSGDPDTIRLAVELGRLHGERGETAQARRVLAAALVTARAALGPDHPLTALVEGGLAAAERPPPPAPPPSPPPAPRPVPVELPLDQPVYRPDGAGQRVAPPVTALAEPVPTAHRARRRAEPVFAAEPWALEPPDPAPARRRGLPRLALVGAALLVVVGSLAAGLALRGHGGGPAGTGQAVTSQAAAPPPSGAAPSAVDGPRPPPGNVTLQDDGTSITVTWTDPSEGAGTVLLALSRGGQPAGPLRPLPAGTQEHVLGGLDPTANYCVIIAMVYPGDAVARADEVCTTRHG